MTDISLGCLLNDSGCVQRQQLCDSLMVNTSGGLQGSMNGSRTGTLRPADEPAANLHMLYFALPGVIGSAICLLGLMGNILNVIVLSLAVRQTSRPTYHILLVLAVSNNCVMFVYLMFTLTFFARDPPIIRPSDLPENASSYHILLFHVWYLIMNGFICASNWFVVAATFFRFLAVRFPMKVGLWCTARRVHFVVAAIFILSAATVLPDALTVEMYYSGDTMRFRDTPLYNDPAFGRVYYTAMHVVMHLLPYAANAVLVTLLLKTLLAGSYARDLRLTVKMRRSASREANNRRITVMLIVMVIFNLVTSLPSVCYLILRDFAGVRDANERSATFLTFRAACDIVELLNYACHFYINLASNSTYRNKFCRTIACLETRDSLRRASQLSVALGAHMRAAHRRAARPLVEKTVNDCNNAIANACLIIGASATAESKRSQHLTAPAQTSRTEDKNYPVEIDF